MDIKDVILGDVKVLCAKAGVPVPPVKFEAIGTRAGCFTFYNISKEHWLDFNLEIATKNGAAYFQRTVPHEIAHYVRWMRNGKEMDRHADGRKDMHGAKWKAVMHELGATDDTAYHSYDVSHVPRRRQRRWAYECGCTTHSIATVTHNKMVKGAGRICSDCKGKLKFAGYEIK